MGYGDKRHFYAGARSRLHRLSFLFFLGRTLGGLLFSFFWFLSLAALALGLHSGNAANYHASEIGVTPHVLYDHPPKIVCLCGLEILNKGVILGGGPGRNLKQLFWGCRHDEAERFTVGFLKAGHTFELHYLASFPGCLVYCSGHLKKKDRKQPGELGLFALGGTGSPDGAAIPALMEALKDANDAVRGTAATALRSLGPAAGAAIPGKRLHRRDARERPDDAVF